ncbi:uncharacterized protein Z518_09793 [Rhinocladiella mackenziei CBS 650.93]|uniref:Carboxylic ester hydrolase n=1 Tax=Rhinocladiella mackenziei CBS 650.93 TaxID=1442369 RepID=A0A0D2GQY6_9EURO|nr:uncharacterized protein Z518_09793 [Rhinocladiella mackenziei CBS 650.93]KIX00728.1 hypothetical protein Z518_09793 [Rhinocladiella mackenziei CBS 650.93]
MKTTMRAVAYSLFLIGGVAAQSCTSFPVIDLGYARHAPTQTNQTALHNISYATYANIRFAQPPVGDLRFRAPQTPPPTSAGIQNGSYPRNATDCLNSIPPYLAIAPGLEGVSWGSEDCLFLTVKVPEGIEGGNVPVVHWLYGGGYVFGSSNDWAGNPAALFEDMAPDEKFIVVSSNYRLGALGWMSSEGVDMTPNAGLWDALVALQWTQNYISYFGGDPDRITVIGESAGAGMASHLLTLRGGNGTVPFNQAILTSPGYRPHVNRSADMTGIYHLFLNATNCSDISCLRGLPTDATAAANRDLLFNVPSSGWLGPLIGYGPIVDGDLVPDVPDRLLAQGKYHTSVEKVMTANMARDGQYSTSSHATSWEDFLPIFMTSPTQETIMTVNATWSNLTGLALDTFAQDAIYACHAFWIAQTWGVNAYRYSMSIPPANHGQDQFYYFHMEGAAATAGPKASQIARRMQKYFRTFILEGRIGGGECAGQNETGVAVPTHWPSYGMELERWMNITEDGFQLVDGEADQANRCQVLLDLIDDPRNGF